MGTCLRSALCRQMPRAYTACKSRATHSVCGALCMQSPLPYRGVGQHPRWSQMSIAPYPFGRCAGRALAPIHGTLCGTCMGSIQCSSQMEGPPLVVLFGLVSRWLSLAVPGKGPGVVYILSLQHAAHTWGAHQALIACAHGAAHLTACGGTTGAVPVAPR